MQELIDQWGARQSQHHPAGISIRLLQPDDVVPIHAMHGRLSPESIYYRYLQHRKPTLEEITALHHLDSATGAGFVATAQQRDEIIVGVAYYVYEMHTQRLIAEPGILVEDRFQGQGIGHNLWQRMQQHAQAHQIQQLRVFFHPNNRPMQRLLLGSGLPYVAKAYGGLLEYLVALEQYPHPISPGSLLADPMRVEIGHSLRNQLIWR